MPIAKRQPKPTTYGPEVGFFQNAWNNPPAPFNPLYDPAAKGRYAAVTASMEADNFYAGHTREECKVEWRRRYEALKGE
ncbi:hypothetical protein [Croceicoccus gelatinilyticus]|uniref:hypothetical protein n=1 Tax=Croceicoccus gelatinilyticus TaxID=2835536 RepID=UPI001BD08C72|nr:hypothetical protein [Croceicoccus gelatinilyticus]MBS7671751.1 hypothetical protein [Croceicoccus gelatinilyticus]